MNDLAGKNQDFAPNALTDGKPVHFPELYEVI